MTEVQCLRLCADNANLLKTASVGVFDHPATSEFIEMYLQGNQNVFFIAVQHDVVIGMVSGLIYNHPDKPLELWINEIGVADDCRRQGVAKMLLESICDDARAVGCVGVWVLTEKENAPANGLYQSMPGWAPKSQVMYWEDFAVGEAAAQQGGQPDAFGADYL